MNSRFIAPLRLALLIVAGCAAPRATGDHGASLLAALAPGWTKIDGGAGTDCALDTPFAFYAHPGNPRRLMIYFQGGGACWNGENCDVEGRPTFKPSVDSTSDPARMGGILSLRNADNPVREYTIVFVPYCTGDTFLGSRTVTYTAGADSKRPHRTFEIHHVGAMNAASAMRWAYAHVSDPEIVFVTGSSAGAIPSPVYAAQAAQHWRKARVVQLGDAGGGYRAPQIPSLLSRSGVLATLRRDPMYRTLDSLTIAHPALYIVSAREAPRATFAQYNAAGDSVQIGFQTALGVKDAPLARTLSENLAEIRSAVPRFRAYTAPGFVHTILLRPQFYTLAVDGVRIRDWVAELLDGKAVGDVGESNLLVGSR
jgi:pectinacetylesterase